MNFLQQIDFIGDKLENLSPSHSDFPALALQILQSEKFPQLFSEELIPDLKTRHQHHGKDCVFSDECFILYVGSNFSIELYHWLIRDTAIHDHDFHGAFQCMKGMNHQVEYKYHSEGEVFPGLEKGNLERIEIREIGPGGLQMIRDEDHFIHVVSHATSTYNLCVRTNPMGKNPLRIYHTDGIRYNVPFDCVSDEIPEEELSSAELMYLFHHSPSGRMQAKKKAALLLNERHGIDLTTSQEKTWEFLNKLSVTAKGY